MTVRELAKLGAGAASLVVVLIVVAQPSGFHRGGCGNETAAIATLRNIHSAQQQFRERAIADADGDGRGEFGLFGELSGECFVRGTRKQLDPPVVSAAFRYVDEHGAVSRSGYRFRLFLPRKGGGSVAERAPTAPSVLVPRPDVDDRPGTCRCCETRRVAREEAATTGPVDADGAEERWYCYAWPAHYGNTGVRSFYIDQRGDVLATDERRDDPPDVQPGRDGRRWSVLP